MVEPVVDELASELDGKVKVGKLNVDQNSATKSSFNITGVPTFILFKYGKAVECSIGAKSKKQLIEMIESTKSWITKRLQRIFLQLLV